MTRLLPEPVTLRYGLWVQRIIMMDPLESCWLPIFSFPWDFAHSSHFHIFYESYDWAEAVFEGGDITCNRSAVVRMVKRGGFGVLI